jgi:hypothetical protein
LSDLAADHIRRSRKTPAPQSVAQHHHRVAARRAVLRWCESASDRRLDSDDRKVIAGRHLAPDPFRLAGAAQIRRNEREVRRDPLEYLGSLVAIVEVVRVGERVALVQADQAGGFPHGQCAEQQPVDDAEHRRVRGDRQRHRYGYTAIVKPGFFRSVRAAKIRSCFTVLRKLDCGIQASLVIRWATP